MELTEKQVSSELKYKGVIVDVYLDRAELCDGKIARLFLAFLAPIVVG